MKKTIYFFSMVAFIALIASACGSKKETKSTDEFVANESAAETAPAGDAISMGESLVKAGDCKTCHHPTNKIIGPSHTDVAKKYEFTQANVEMLAQKIIKGGMGNWGQVPMTAHPDLSQADAEKMARYVLSLDGEKEH